MTSRLLPVSAIALTLGGCGKGDYPSLAQRPAELRYTTQIAPPAVASPPGKPDAAVVHQVEDLRAEAAKSSDVFTQRANDAEHLARAAHGTAVGSEAWSASTVAMAALDSARSDTAQPLGVLDALQAKMAVTAADTSNANDKATFDVIARADAEVGAMMDHENARIAALHAMTGD